MELAICLACQSGAKMLSSAKALSWGGAQKTIARVVCLNRYVTGPRDTIISLKARKRKRIHKTLANLMGSGLTWHQRKFRYLAPTLAFVMRFIMASFVSTWDALFSAITVQMGGISRGVY